MSSRIGSQAPTLSDRDTAEVLKDVSKVKQYLKKLESAGAEPPKDLKAAIIKLESAAKSGKDVADAADEAHEELKKHTVNMKNDCKNIGKKHEENSRNGKEGLFQGRGAKYTLDPDADGSEMSESLGDALKWLGPDAICKRWERCADMED
jgi:hypothetical protein